MRVGVGTVVYHGYGQWLPQWCAAVGVAGPDLAVCVLGQGHGLTDAALRRCRDLLPQLIVVNDQDPPTMGRLWDVACAHLDTDWLQIVDVDDILYPHALAAYARHAPAADVLLPAMHVCRGARQVTRVPYTPAEAVHRPRMWFGNSLVLRRQLWQQVRIQPHDSARYTLVADLVEAGARFVVVDEPCLRYVQRPDGHAARVLGKRGGPVMPEEKRQAERHRLDMQDRIRAHFGVG